MVFLGYRFHLRVTGGGKLHCQRCGGDRQYRSCAGRRWLHVCYLPVLPLDRVAEHVQCTNCGTRYRMAVLAMPTAQQMLAALPAGTKAAVVAMVQAGEPGSALARASAIDTIRAAGLDGYGESELGADLGKDGASWDKRGAVRRLAVQMVMPAHEWFLADVVRVGLADGPLTDDERVAACEIASFLGLTSAKAYDVIWATEEAAAG